MGLGLEYGLFIRGDLGDSGMSTAGGALDAKDDVWEAKVARLVEEVEALPKPRPVVAVGAVMVSPPLPLPLPIPIPLLIPLPLPLALPLLAPKVDEPKEPKAEAPVAAANGLILA